MEQKWLVWAHEMQAVAQIGLTSRMRLARERTTSARQLSADIMGIVSAGCAATHVRIHTGLR